MWKEIVCDITSTFFFGTPKLLKLITFSRADKFLCSICIPEINPLYTQKHALTQVMIFNDLATEKAHLPKIVKFLIPNPSIYSLVVQKLLGCLLYEKCWAIYVLLSHWIWFWGFGCVNVCDTPVSSFKYMNMHFQQTYSISHSISFTMMMMNPK